MSSLRSRSGGQADDVLVQAGEEIAAELPLLHVLVQIAVRRAHDADVHVLGRRRAEREDLARLEDAQELRLRVERHVADLVEEERPAVGELDEPGLVAVGAGERAAAVAEELALEEVVRDGGAVDRLERSAPPARAVKPARGDLLARCRSRRG